MKAVTNLLITFGEETKMRYIVDEIAEDYVLVNAESSQT